MPVEMIDSDQAAKLLGVSRRTLQLWIKQGEFPHAYKLRPGNRFNSPYRIPLEEVQKFLDRRNPKGDN